MRKFIFGKFILCGCIGWCLECFWTGAHSILEHRDLRFPCNTSIWMFPIYGMGAFISPLSKLIKGHGFFFRGAFYTVCIYLTEFFSGKWLKRRNACPWDYTSSKFHYKGLIRLDYAPVWFTVGLLYEKILS